MTRFRNVLNLELQAPVVLPRLFKLSPWVDLDPFYAKVKFGHIGFCMGKSENYLFSETIAALGLKVA